MAGSSPERSRPPPRAARAATENEEERTKAQRWEDGGADLGNPNRHRGHASAAARYRGRDGDLRPPMELFSLLLRLELEVSCSLGYGMSWNVVFQFLDAFKQDWPRK